ncbi:MAG: hypothetical protein WB509_28840 [Acetobacteraceae bacterium]
MAASRAHEGKPITMTTKEDLPPPSEPPADEPYQAPAPAVRPTPALHGIALAAAALVITLTAPFWEDGALATLGIRTPLGRTAQQNALAVMRQDRRTEDISQRLATATTQLAKQQTELTVAMQRADAAAALIRTLSLVRLSDTLRRPMPFAAELATVRVEGTDLGDLKPLLDKIEPYARTGIPGTTQLRQEFRTLLDQVSRGGPQSWMTNLAVWARLRGTSPTPADADPSLDLLQSASARLADVDIAGALDDTRQLSDAYRPVFSNWSDDAQARVAADSIAARVSDMVTRTLRTRAAN